MSAVSATSSSSEVTGGAGDDPLIQLRLAYLRAVALSWRDDAFRQQLTSGEDVQQQLQERCGLRIKWPALDIVVTHSIPPLRWNPLEVGGWMGPDDQFVITLPGTPESEHDRPEALAAYYQRFPTLMGVALHQAPEAATFASATGGSDVPTSAVLLPFGGVLLRAIALAWADAEFRRALLDSQDARPVLSRFFGYNLPFNFRVHVRAGGPTVRIDGAWRFEALKNRIKLNYPEVPTQAERLWPVALTAYNDTGPAYPFTC